MYNILSFIKNWFSKKEKPKETKPETKTQVILFDCVDAKTEFQEPFHADDDIEDEDWFDATELAGYKN